ncbi:MAG: hypothetical protein NT027_05205 [Proteobacteria bacterium]|nr:hypothetical protein [Pseudomonadota bacterium]
MIQRISLLACLTACTFFHVSCKSVGTKSSEKDVAYKDSEGRFIYVKYSYQNKRYSLITCKENAVLKDVRRPNPFTIEGDKAQHEAYMKQLTENCPETAENRVMLSEDMMKTYLTDFYTYRHIAGNGEPVDDFLQWIRRAADLNKSREKERLTGELDRMKESLQSKKAVLKQIKKSGLISYLDQDKVYNLSADVDRLIKSIETYDPNKINTAPQIAWNLTWETNFANWMADKVYPLLTGSYETFILDKDNLLHSGLISAFTNYKNLKTAKFVSTSGDRLNLIKPSEDGNYLLVKGFNSYVYRTNQEQAKLSKIGGRLLEGHINSRDLAKSFTFDWDVSDGPKLTQIDQPALGQSNSGGAKSLKLPSSIANPIDRGITGNGNRIYAFSNRVLESWDVSNIDFVTQPKALKVFQPKPDSPIFDVRVSNDGKLGAIYYYDKIIVVAMDREVSPLQVLSVPNTPIRNYDSCIPYFSYDSKYIACIKSGMINVWNTATGKLHLSLNIATEPG